EDASTVVSVCVGIFAVCHFRPHTHGGSCLILGNLSESQTLRLPERPEDAPSTVTARVRPSRGRPAPAAPGEVLAPQGALRPSVGTARTPLHLWPRSTTETPASTATRPEGAAPLDVLTLSPGHPTQPLEEAPVRPPPDRTPRQHAPVTDEAPGLPASAAGTRPAASAQASRLPCVPERPATT